MEPCNYLKRFGAAGYDAVEKVSCTCKLDLPVKAVTIAPVVK